MSIEHELIAELLEQHEGHEVHVTSTRRGAPIPAFSAKIPADYDGNIALANGSLVAVPARGVRYTEIVVTDATGNVVQRLLPARSGSTERAILANMLTEAKNERAQAQQEREAAAARAEAQRLTMLKEAQQAAAQAKADRDALAAQQLQRDNAAAAERSQLMQAITALTATANNNTPTRALGFAPGSTATNPVVIGSGGSTTTSLTSVVSLPQDLVDMMKRREVAESKIFSSWASPGEYFTEGQKQTLRNYFPEYKWLKTHPKAPTLRQALRHIADGHTQHAGSTHVEHLAAIITCITAAGHAATSTQAAEVQAMMGIAQTASGTLDWPRVILCELALLGVRALEAETVLNIKAARAILADDPSAGVGDISSLPIRTTPSEKRDRNEKRGAAQGKSNRSTASTASTQSGTMEERKCRQCGKLFKGAWTQASCAAGHF